MSTYEAMREMALERAWRLDPEEPGVLNLYSTVSLIGAVEGVPIRLERIAALQLFTTIAMIDPPLAPTFAITNEGLVDKVAHFFGRHDVEVDDPAFDPLFQVKSNDPDGTRRLLTDEVRATLVRLHDAVKPLGMRGFQVSESGVSISRVTSVSLGNLPLSREELLHDVPLALAVIRALRAAAG